MEALSAVNAGDDVPVQRPAGPAYRADLALKRADVDRVKGHNCAFEPFTPATTAVVIVVGAASIAAAVNAAAASSPTAAATTTTTATVADAATAGAQDTSCA